MSPSLSLSRGPSSSFQQRLTSEHEEQEEEEEEGVVKQGQSGKFFLTDFKETLKALDDSSEIRWLTELLPLCPECQNFMAMGNQQGTKLKHNQTERRSALPKSPRIQIPRRKGRRAGQRGSTGDLVMTPQGPLTARRPTKVQMMSSPVFGDFEEEWPIICTPAARRRRVSREQKKNECALTLGGKLPGDSRSLSKKGSRKDFSVEEEFDSDSELSEYDNDMYCMMSSVTCEEETEGVKNSQQWFDEMEKREAALRVMHKIEEVEGIIRQVSLSSSDWIQECCEDGSEPLFDGAGQEALQQFLHPDFSASCWQCSEDSPQLVEELHALGEALSQSLLEALRTEEAKAESAAFTEAEKRTRRPLDPPSCPYRFTSAVPNHSSSPHAVSPTLSVVLDDSTSSSLDRLSPILSPLMSGLSMGDQDEAETDSGEDTAGASTVRTENDQRKSQRRPQKDYLLSSGKTNQCNICDGVKTIF